MTANAARIAWMDIAVMTKPKTTNTIATRADAANSLVWKWRRELRPAAMQKEQMPSYAGKNAARKMEIAVKEPLQQSAVIRERTAIRD